MRRSIVVFTSVFPYGGTADFMTYEIGVLSEAFDKVLLVPSDNVGGTIFPLPKNVMVDLSVAKANKRRFRQSLRNNTSVLGVNGLINEIINAHYPKTHPRAFGRLFLFLGQALEFYKWANANYENHLRDSICYSYWMHSAAYALTLLKRKYPLTVISRVHGFDVYAEQHYPPYMPCHEATVSGLDKVYAISENGHKRLTQLYPQFTDKFAISRLGTVDPECTSPISPQHELRVASCSSIVPVKRIPLLIDGLIEFHKRFPHTQLYWDHLGGGVLFESVKDYAKTLPDGVKWHMWGQVSHEEVIKFYCKNSVDVFVNVSASEGVPVSIMEAQSCGIPVIATSVGGTPEIVNTENGLLISEQASPSEIAEALYHFTSKPLNKRTASRKWWMTHYNAISNYENFVKILNNL
jgi:glycosyltransferase involved in cell wall biosynthesis